MFLSFATSKNHEPDKMTSSFAAEFTIVLRKLTADHKGARRKQSGRGVPQLSDRAAAAKAQEKIGLSVEGHGSKEGERGTNVNNRPESVISGQSPPPWTETEASRCWNSSGSVLTNSSSMSKSRLIRQKPRVLTCKRSRRIL